MIQQLLLAQLDRLASRERWLRLFQFLSLVWITAAVAGGLLWAWARQSAHSGFAPALLLVLVTLFLAFAVIWRIISRPSNYSSLAGKVEENFPELHTSLLAAIEQRPDPTVGEFGYLQTSVMREALQHAYRHRWPDLISQRRLLLEGLANAILFVIFGAAVFGALLTAAKSVGPLQNAAAALLLPPGQKFVMNVEPGDTEIEWGSSLLVLARIHGQMPAEASLHFTTPNGDETVLAMPPSLADPVFGVRIPVVEEPVEYFVRAENQSSPKYRVTVFEYPKLERADAKLVYPSYTNLEARTIQDVRTVSAVEGTKLTVSCVLNKPVALAQLTNSSSDATGEPIVLEPNSRNPKQYDATLTLTQSRRLKLELVDDAGRQNQKQEQFTINVLPNHPPVVKPLFPARDLEVSALEEVDTHVSVTDDFGVRRAGLTYALAGQPPVEVVLSENAAAKQKHEFIRQISLENLGAEPDQLLSYYWWAEDIDAAGQVRRTQSDMYFAEVRPFEEIFRQGEQPPGGAQQQQQQGQGQNAQDAQQLAKLQKDIINATWKVIRREIAAELSQSFADDVEQIRLSQAAAHEQASALAERLQDEKSLAHAEEVLKQMETAVSELQSAQQGRSRDPLQPALAAEQAAYQGLLKLRAREHEVVRQQQQQQQGRQSQQQSNSRSQQQQQQLNQLDLKQEENRYETQRTAQERQEESAADRENRQVLNRLRELAQRQHDLNERLKELQAALEAAETPAEKEEIRRQLQRLQDEERQILQDTDELQSRLDQPENQERMAEQQRQLDETRDQVRRASEALQQERVGQAAAAGTRAEQQFDELREEFRRRAANSFSEEVQQLREAARELENREQNIAEQLRGEQSGEKPAEQPKSKSLRDDDETKREPIAQELAEQRKRLTNLQDQMRDTIERAETTEPILSERLYESARNLRDQKIDRALQSAERSVRQGLNQDAQQQEAVAGEGLRQLREGIERAAEGVLGDETEALRRARNELEQLSRELNDEVRRNGGELNEEAERGQQTGQQNQAGNQQPQNGQQANGEQRPGQRQPGQRPGQQESGQQAGQGQPMNGEQPMPSQGQPMNQGQPSAGQPIQPGERGQQPGQRGEQLGQSQQPGQPMNGQQPGQAQPQQQPGERGQQNQPGQQPGEPNQRGGFTGPYQTNEQEQAGPLTGERFREWSDRLRDVEEMVGDPQLRADAARIRERARAVRADAKRHSAPPNWDLVREQLLNPLNELEKRVAEEVLKRTSKKALVPLDRDPVPPEYSEKTRKYYERLGSGK